MRTVEEMVNYYRDMRSKVSSVSTYEEAKWQYIAMAQGKDGGPTGEVDGSTIRDKYYPGYPDSFFRDVGVRMAWIKEGGSSFNQLEAYSADPV